MTNTPAMPIFGHRMKCWCLLAMVFLQVSGGCTTEPPAMDEPARESSVASVSGFEIPLFATSTEQLNYAKSLNANPREKSAALNLIFGRFPDDRRQLGEARLELAYLYLGRDFRLADKNACEQALNAYESIAREFSDLPAVRAKAYWYRAWITTDLLKDKPSGLALYSMLADQYPEDRFSRISPVPWLKLVFPNPEKTPYTADDAHTHSWAGLALLEIVRNAEDAGMRDRAFEKLWKDHRTSLTTGYALKEILRRPPTLPGMDRIVAEYVTGNTINSQLNHDLRSGLADGSAPEAIQ